MGAKKPPENKLKTAPRGKIKTSQPKSHKLLQEITETTQIPTLPRHKTGKAPGLPNKPTAAVQGMPRKRDNSGPGFQVPNMPKGIGERRGSTGGFLEQESAM